MTGERPAFWDWLIGEPGRWTLRDGASEEIVRELVEWITFYNEGMKAPEEPKLLD